MFIGNFKLVGDNFTGVIKTLTFKTDAVFEPIEKKSEKAPDCRATNGNTDIGVAWKKTSEAGNAYLSVQLEIRRFRLPSCAAWSRPAPNSPTAWSGNARASGNDHPTGAASVAPASPSIAIHIPKDFCERISTQYHYQRRPHPRPAPASL